MLKRLPPRTRAITSAGMAGALGLALTATGLVALPGSAAASGHEAWTLEGAPAPFDRYTAKVDPAHLTGDSVVRPGLDPQEPDALLETAAAAAPGQFDPQEVLRAAALVGAPAALESVDGVLQLRGPRGVVVLGSDALQPATTASAGGAGGPASGSGEAYAVPDTAPSAISQELLTRLQAAPGVHSATPLHGGLVLLTVPRGAPAPSGLPGVSDVEPDAVGQIADLAGLPDDPWSDRSWALANPGGQLPGWGVASVAGADLGALGAWPRTRGDGVTVAVLDTGYAAHRDLDHALWTNDGEGCSGADADRNGFPADCHGWNFYTGTNDVRHEGSNLHGTIVASLVAGAVGDGYGMSGISPDVELMPVVVGTGGSGGIPLSAVVEGIRYAADNGADIINMSFIGPWSGTEAGVRLEAAMTYAAGKGALLVAAAGNDEKDRDRYPQLPASSPNPSLLTVGASTPDDRRAYFSAYGTGSVDVFAPGMYVPAAHPTKGVDWAHGTSIASPLAAGVAALLQSADPSLRGSALRRRIMDTAAAVPALAPYGAAGRVDARAALGSLPTALQVDVDGLDTLLPDTAGSVRVRLSGDGSGLPDGPLGMRLRLVTTDDTGQVYDVADAPVDAGAAGSGVTDDSGSITLTPEGLNREAVRAGVAVALTTELPEGRYAALVQLTDGGRAVADRFAVPFTVGRPAAVTPPAASPAPSWQPVGGAAPTPTTAPTAPGPSSPAPSTPAPSTPAPASPAPASPAPAPSDGPRPSSPPTAPPTAPAGPDVPTAPAAPPVPGVDGPVDPVRPPVDAVPAPSRPDPAPSAPVVPDGPDGPDAPDQLGSPAPNAPAPGGASPAPPSRAPVPSDSDVDDATLGIERLSPGSGGVAGGQRVVLHGTRLPERPAVLFGGVPAEVVAVDAPASITVVTPARAAGPVDVIVFDTASTDLSGSRRSTTLRGAFTYVADAPAPSPSAPPGTPTPPTAAPAPTTPGPPSPTAPAPTWNGPGASPAPTRTSAPGTRGRVRLIPVSDVDPVLLAHASCGASCTGLRL